MSARRGTQLSIFQHGEDLPLFQAEPAPAPKPAVVQPAYYPIGLHTDHLNRMELGRVNAALDKLWTFPCCGVLTLRQHLTRHPWISKSKCIQTHTLHRVNLCYEELARPITHYGVDYIEDGHKCAFDIPKIVYDCLDLPEGPTGHMG